MDQIYIDIVLSVLQALLLLAVAPLITGIIRKIKAYAQQRQGASILQPYRDIAKYFHKDSVVSRETSWIFSVTPYISMAAVLIAALIVPVFITRTLGFVGDLIVVVYLLGTVRFFTALAALDAGSAFGGMGSSREMMVSSIVEPTMLLSIFAMGLISGTTSLGSIASALSISGIDLVRPALFLASAAFLISTIAENARVPVDNPTTHLELTMIHEGMILEYSGKKLGLMELSSMTRLVLYFTILSNVFFPWGIANDLSVISLGVGLVAILGKVLFLALVIAIIESSISKLRLFRLPNLLTVSFTLALLAVMSFYIL
ncbi:MAG TPA: NADH-quinone oxidoreductase subunit H [Methanomassiliicoccales archaeon]